VYYSVAWRCEKELRRRGVAAELFCPPVWFIVRDRLWHLCLYPPSTLTTYFLLLPTGHSALQGTSCFTRLYGLCYLQR